MTKEIIEREWYLITEKHPLSVHLEKEIQDCLDILTDKDFDTEETQELKN